MVRGRKDGYHLYFLTSHPSLSLAPSLLFCRKGKRDTIVPQRSFCRRLDSCHANTPTAIIGALMGLSLTWERGSKRETEASRGKSVQRRYGDGVYGENGERWSGGCNVERGGKDRRTGAKIKEEWEKEG